MISSLVAAVVVAALASDPCAPVTSAPTADPETAAVYRSAGDDERAAGNLDAAAIAYRKAAELDAKDLASRRALQDLCASRGSSAMSAGFARGLALMQGGDYRGAAEQFDAELRSAPDPAASLLAGVCRYQIGDLKGAEALLRQAEADPAHTALARYYLGLVAVSENRFREASTLFEEATAGAEVAPLARDLARYAWRNQRLVLSASTAVGWDSNATLAPAGTPVASASDGFLAAGASAVYRPTGETGPYLRVAGLMQEQFQVHSLDMLGASAGAGWQFGRLGNAVVLAYDYDFRTLGGSPYLSASRLGASGWVTVGPAVLTASYFARFEAYLPSLFDPFDGTLQHAELKCSFGLGRTAWITAGYGISAASVQLDYLSWVEHGPRAVLRWLPGTNWKLAFEAGAAFRTYGAVAPGPGTVRADTYLDGAAVAEYYPSLQWTLWVSLTARRALSNVPQYDYTSIAPTIGVSFATGM